MRRTVYFIAVALLVLATSQAFSQQLPGAIYTGIRDASEVNLNQYQDKCDVYLLGGPGPNAPPDAAGLLPDTEFYFQVTDPSGKVLLSSDDIEERRFLTDEDGRIIEYLGTTHDWATAAETVENQGASIQLCPYDDTPNPGGVYKVWATPVDRYDEGSGVFGFIPAWSKTDNYKVKRQPVPPPLICVRKFIDLNANGVEDGDDYEYTGWPVTIIEPTGVQVERFTPVCYVAFEGTFQVCEDENPAGDLPCEWVQTALIVDGAPVVPPTQCAEVVIETDALRNRHVAEAEEHLVEFGNVKLGTVEVCKFYDRDGDGEQDEDETTTIPGWKFELTGTYNTPSGPVTIDPPLEFTADATGCVTLELSNDECGLYPGSYEICEVLPPPTAEITWVASTDTCYEFDLTAGDERAFKFGNYCTGTADFSTKGYWHNKNGLSEIEDEDIDYVNTLDPYDDPTPYFGDGDEPFDGEFEDGTCVQPAIGDGTWQGEEIAPECSARAEISQFLVDPNGGTNPPEQLAQQLLAFIFNTIHRLNGDCSSIVLPDGTVIDAGDLIDEAIDIWANGTSAEQIEMASLLDDLNNSDAVPFISCEPCDVIYNGN